MQAAKKRQEEENRLQYEARRRAERERVEQELQSLREKQERRRREREQEEQELAEKMRLAEEKRRQEEVGVITSKNVGKVAVTFRQRRSRLLSEQICRTPERVGTETRMLIYPAKEYQISRSKK